MYSAANTQILAWQAKLKYLFIPQGTHEWPKALPFSIELQMYEVAEKEFQSAIWIIQIEVVEEQVWHMNLKLGRS